MRVDARYATAMVNLLCIESFASKLDPAYNLLDASETLLKAHEALGQTTLAWVLPLVSPAVAVRAHQRGVDISAGGRTQAVHHAGRCDQAFLLTSGGRAPLGLRLFSFAGVQIGEGAPILDNSIRAGAAAAECLRGKSMSAHLRGSRHSEAPAVVRSSSEWSLPLLLAPLLLPAVVVI